MQQLIITPFVGIGEIRFGLREDALMQLLGEPDEIMEDEFTDQSISRSLEYQSLGLQLILDSEDGYRLTTITATNQTTTINDIAPVGKTEEELKALADALGVTDLVLDDELSDLGSKDYYSDSKGLSFWIVDELVDSVSMFPAYEEDGETIIWPD